METKTKTQKEAPNTNMRPVAVGHSAPLARKARKDAALVSDRWPVPLTSNRPWTKEKKKSRGHAAESYALASPALFLLRTGVLVTQCQRPRRVGRTLQRIWVVLTP
jgi:hypothetical protein